MKHDIDIIHEDEALIIANKPSGLLSIPDRFDADKPSLYQLLSNRFGKIYIVHRLDRETSGILCFAKTEEAHKQLSQQFQERTVEKIYYVLLEGVLSQDSGEIDQPIAPHPTIPGKMITTAKGKASLTHYKVVERFKHFTLVEADLKTGRTHQIRVHFPSIGHPLAVDALYGRHEGFFLSTVKTRNYNLGKFEEERPLMSRTSLHAFRLCLNHPTTGERVCYETALPKDFGAVLKQLRKWGKD